MIRDKRIIVTGGSGFLGKHIVELLEKENDVFVPRSKDYNLTIKKDVTKMFRDYGEADILIHAAAVLGGIGYSSSHSAEQFYINTLINTNVVHESYLNNIKKFVGIGSVCEYPANTPVPFKEEEIWNGYPVETNDAYGLTKRMLLAQCIAYKRDYEFNAIHLLPVNLYGPGDNFDYKTSHVIPALIRKIIDATNCSKSEIEVWGTGFESREFIFVKDAAKAIVLASEHYNKIDPINIGSGEEIQIRDIAEILAKILNYQGDFKYLNNGLGGQQRRMLDVSRAFSEFGFKAETSFEKGLNETIEYFVNEYHTVSE